MEKYKSLSRDLYAVMENCGFTAEVRDTKTEMARILEIFLTLYDPPYISTHIFGSHYEGTGTELGSDQDMVGIRNDIPVVTNIGDCPSHQSLLLLPDKQPGYAKLQLVTNNKPVFSDNTNKTRLQNIGRTITFQSDEDDRICMTRNPHSKLQANVTRQGPAIHYKINERGHIYEYDHLIAFKCTKWPSLASEWLHRERNNGWPSPELIEECQSLGFLVVPAFHPDSDRQEFQWRVSFSEQERLVVTQFNSVQVICYVLLKIIKNEIVKRQIQEETLTSYHCKTCMLYLLENKPREFWIPENLVICLITCLWQIHVWVKDNNCPNYFIPEENMFDRITDTKLRKKLHNVLDKILKSDFRTVLEKVKTNNIGEILTGSYQSTQEQRMKQFQAKVKIMVELLFGVTYFRNTLLQRCYNKTLGSFVNNLDNFYQHMISAKTISGHSEKETQTAKSLILPFIKVHALSCKVVKKIQEGESYLEILTCKEWDKQGPFNCYSRLKQGMAMSVLGRYQNSIDVILGVLDNRRRSFCNCASDLFCFTEKLLIPANTDIAVIELYNNCCKPCIVCLPAEQQITQAAINYEMIRSYAMYPSSDCFGARVWVKWGVADGIFLEHFLLYLDFQALRLNSRAKSNIKKMINLLNKKYVYHRETCFNLLGWIHKQRGDTTRAVQCFRKSLEVRSTYNAAFWHLCFLICG